MIAAHVKEQRLKGVAWENPEAPSLVTESELGETGGAWSSTKDGEFEGIWKGTVRSRRIDGFKGYPRKDERGDEDGDDEASEEMTTTGQERYESEERE
ncbi:hypothetical protein IFM47457_07862 [Aspergillus lentulus]|nr:hypothetical protein IFM47457_07862 [Aspergillus lentulus]